jgi:flagellar assembly protein FliH
MSKGLAGGDAGDCRPWQFASFDPPRSTSLPTAADIENVHRQARDEGYGAGYAEGRAAAQAEVRRLHALVDAAAHDLGRLDQQVADALLALALEIARRVVGEAFRVRPDLVLPVVQEALRCLPEFEQGVRVHLNPEDASLVETGFGDGPPPAGWQIIADGAIARGGCRLVTTAAAVDATLEQRWERVLAALGQRGEWLA